MASRAAGGVRSSVPQVFSLGHTRPAEPRVPGWTPPNGRGFGWLSDSLVIPSPQSRTSEQGLTGRYCCQRRHDTYGEPRCQQMAVIVPEIRGGATVMDDVFGDD